MTLDAYDWAWKYARSRGNARLAVLAVADKTTGPEATARLGLAETQRRLGGVGKGVAVKALADAVKAGDLIEEQASAGSRATLYRIPGAVNYRRSGPESGPVAAPEQGSGIRTTNAYRSGIQTSKATPTGPESGPVAEEPEDGLWSVIRTASGPESGPHHPPIERVSEGEREGAAPALDLTAGGIPPFARPLVDQITAADVFVGWDLTPNEWLRLDAMLRRSGADMLARHAVTLAARQTVTSARYFLRAWTSLPPAPTEGTVAAAPVARPAGNVIPLDRSQPRGRAAQSADHLAAALAAMEAQQ
ncbi:hypothetical protein AB0D33_38095 [Streptomyces sp. NPDC048404]|uniref:hypothetical protein n=1 Tax=unclassified Streptomyces TaxID=2593676 RepID=UPI00344A426F